MQYGVYYYYYYYYIQNLKNTDKPREEILLNSSKCDFAGVGAAETIDTAEDGFAEGWSERKRTWGYLPFKKSAFSAGDVGLIPGSGRSLGEENAFQYSCLENSMDRGV